MVLLHGFFGLLCERYSLIQSIAFSMEYQDLPAHGEPAERGMILICSQTNLAHNCYRRNIYERWFLHLLWPSNAGTSAHTQNFVFEDNFSRPVEGKGQNLDT